MQNYEIEYTLVTTEPHGWIHLSELVRAKSLETALEWAEARAKEKGWRLDSVGERSS